MINFVHLASDSQMAPSTVRQYYAILKDTFIAHEVPALSATAKRKAVSTAKYYLFDIGLARHLQGRRGLAPGTPEYGSAFESFISGNQGVLRLPPVANAALLALQIQLREHRGGRRGFGLDAGPAVRGSNRAQAARQRATAAACGPSVLRAALELKDSRQNKSSLPTVHRADQQHPVAPVDGAYPRLRQPDADRRYPSAAAGAACMSRLAQTVETTNLSG